MGYFKWFGYDDQEHPQIGYIASADHHEITRYLQQKGISCVHISKINHFLRPCTFAERQAVLQELSQLLESNVRLSQALKIISSLVKKEYIRQVLLDCMRSVDQGKVFADVAQQHPELFDILTIHALKAGNDSGLLAQACLNRSEQLAQIAQIRLKIAHALAMPLLTGSFFIAVCIFLFIVILPQFKKIFALLKATLPMSTQLLLKIADYVTLFNIICLLSALFMTSIALIALGKTLVGKKIYDNFLLSCWGVASIYKDLARAQCLNSLALLISSGIPLAPALGRVAESFNNRVVRLQLTAVQHAVELGKPFTQAIDGSALLAVPEIKNCLAIAHETAEVEVILLQLSKLFRIRALKKLNRITLLIQPILLIALGAAIGGVLLALYLPLLQMPQGL